MRVFDYVNILDGVVPITWIDKISKIIELNTCLKVKELEKSYSLKNMEKSSLEKRVNSILKLEDNIELRKVAIGYSRIFRDLHLEDYSLTMNNMLSLHNELMRDVSKYYEKGMFQSSDNVVLETDVYGSRKIRIMPLSAEDTPAVVENLISAYNASINKVSSLLIIPIFILDFLCIHPFMYSNGHMSRLLTTALLMNAGFNVAKYLSIEEYILKHENEYYSALQESSENWSRGKNDPTKFVEFFLEMIETLYLNLEDGINIEIKSKLSKKERIVKIIKRSPAPVSKKEIAAAVPDISITTIELVIGELVKANKIEKIGANKNAKYMTPIKVFNNK